MPCNQPFNSGISTKNVTKQATENLLIQVDWCDTLEDTDTVNVSAWAVDSGDVTLSGAVLDGYLATVQVAGGIAGTVYKLTNMIDVTTESGVETLETVIELYIGEV